MSVSDIRLQLLIGPSVPVPAPPAVLDALDSVQVTSGDRGRDGFSLAFGLEKAPVGEYSLLRLGLFKPLSRVRIAVFLGARKHILIDGVVVQAQVQAGDRPGSARLSVTGEDVRLLMALKHIRKPHPGQADAQIVTALIEAYNLTPVVERPKDVPLRNGRQPTQNSSDLQYIEALARLNGYVFSIEPDLGAATDKAAAYWGPPLRREELRPDLAIDLGPASNVESVSITFDTARPVDPLVRYLNLERRRLERVSPPAPADPLVRRPAEALRQTIAANTAKLSPPRATARMDAERRPNDQTVTVSGELDVLRYGAVLRARRKVRVCGAGLTYDGQYSVQRVTHTIKCGAFRQRFELAREGVEPTR
jgi:hypothetical protein